MSTLQDAKTPITPEELAGAEHIEDLKISKDGANVVYVVRPAHKIGEHAVSALWSADTFQEESARKVTSGTYRDYSPSFHPTSSRVFFLSDREDAGGLSQLFSLSLEASESSVVRITDLAKEHGVASYSISPNGYFVAFTAEVKKAKKDGKDPIVVWREEEQDAYTTLQLIDLRESLGLRTGMKPLVDVSAHVDSFSWSPDSSAIVYRLLDHRDVESQDSPVKEQIVTISGKIDELGSFTYSHMPASATVWRESGDFVFLQGVEPSMFCSAICLWSRSTSAGASALAYGVTNDVSSIVDLGSHSQFAVQVAEGFLTKFDVYDEENKVFTAFDAPLEYSIETEWDMTLTSEGTYVFVAIRSSGVSGQPQDVWSGVTKFNQPGTISKKLSSHNLWYESKTPLIFKQLNWAGADGVELGGVITYPKDTDPRSLPVFVYPHGGPSARDILYLHLTGYATWRPFLASNGYLVLSPNYRGSTGRGNDFAMAAQGGVGTVDWDDIEAMIEAAISQGIAGPNSSIGIGGWSQGGFETAWGCTRPGNRFKAGVMGAGVCDWGFMAAQSDIPDGEAALAGGAPWTPGEPLYLRGSPIKDVKNVTAPILMLHGKEDPRVPVTQAIEFLRGIEREGQATVRPKLVIYPREGHDFKEHAHVVDVLQRLLEHLRLYLK